VPVGKRLADERRAQGKTIMDIERSSKIRGRLIEALENEQWDALPVPVYVKGYIQNYAAALGIDSTPLLAEYARDIGRPAGKVTLDDIPEKTVVPHTREVHALPREAWIALAAGVVVLALVAWGISSLFSSDEEPPPIPPETTATVDPTGSVGSALPAGSFTLGISVEDGRSSRLVVVVDGLTAYEGTLTAAEPKEWTVTESATLTIGDPEAVTVTRNGAAVQIPPSDGEAEIVLNAGE